ncbi:hypothetical protein CEXT_2081 [Caerostris extrusa]|uniref:LAGLIDADG homing endonuclease n=1 Tax=Caerostris extrusa TaxID=172846 RepID=A0AAV4XFU4_CAEEX|nr:hypothetical protein CEXT_2081 [Caerostris extrusa]
MLCGLKRIRFTGAGRSIPACYFEVTKGSPEQVANYCKKDGDLEEYGRLPRMTFLLHYWSKCERFYFITGANEKVVTQYEANVKSNYYLNMNSYYLLRSNLEHILCKESFLFISHADFPNPIRDIYLCAILTMTNSNNVNSNSFILS